MSNDNYYYKVRLTVIKSVETIPTLVAILPYISSIFLEQPVLHLCINCFVNEG